MKIQARVYKRALFIDTPFYTLPAMHSDLSFTIEKKAGRARAGLISLREISVPTPVFMPVGTRASVKAVSQGILEEIGYHLILGNTYHLYLRPGTDVFDSFGSLGRFMAWPHLILTDSGGFQAYSLSELTEYNDDGVHFKSHLDGSSHLFTPEKVLDIQRSLHSDIVMPLDDCAPYPADEKRLRNSLERTHRWLKQSAVYFEEKEYNRSQNLFGIVQGGIDLAMRRESAGFVNSLNLAGNAIGGLSVGEKNDDFLAAIETSCENLSEDKPRYLMGVGSIPEIIKAVAEGVDMMDCVLPTRNARNGQVFTSSGKLNLRREDNRFSNEPVDSECACPVCNRYSRGYIRHLHKTNELLGYELATHHNLFFMHRFMQNMRESIVNGNFNEFSRHYLTLFEK